MILASRVFHTISKFTFQPYKKFTNKTAIKLYLNSELKFVQKEIIDIKKNLFFKLGKNFKVKKRNKAID